MLEVTKAGYVREYEIKVDRADFRADAQKHRRTWGAGASQRVRELKHDRLAAAAAGSPNRFSFVCPAGLVTVGEVPGWAGLILAHRRRNYHRRPWCVTLEVVKPAPWLHREKAPHLLRARMRECAYWRYLGKLIYDNENEIQAQTDPTTEQGNGSQDGLLPDGAEALPG